MGIAKSVKNAFKIVEDNEAWVFKKMPKLKGKYQAAIGIGALGYGAVTGGLGAVEDSHYGTIEAGGMANMVNETRSADFDSQIANAQSDPEYFNDEVLHGNFSARNSAVSPEIVFALHNLRKGGGE